MNVLYLTFGELASTSGIIKSQVLDIVRDLSSEDNINVHLLMVSPVINKSGIKELVFRNKKVQKEISKNIGSARFIKHNLFFPGRLFHSSGFLFGLFHSYNTKKLAKYIEENDISIVHCRSYHAAFEAVKARKKYSLNCNILFDPRGLLPEEVLIKTSSTLDFEFFKNIENDILKNVDAISCVSNEMAIYFRNQFFEKSVHVNYACFEPPSESEILNSSLTNKIKTLCYVGNISESGYHTISALSKLYGNFRNKFDGTRLLIISHSNRDEIIRSLDIPENELEIVGANNSYEVHKLLKERADYGALPYKLDTNDDYDSVAETMIGNKTIEYLFAGVKPIVNIKCTAAVNLIRKCGFGMVFDPSAPEEIYKPELDENVARLEDLLIEFTTRAVAKKYFEIYLDLYGEQYHAKN